MADIDGDKFICRQCDNKECRHYDWFGLMPCKDARGNINRRFEKV